MHSIRIEGSDRAGAVAKLTEALAAAGVNLRGLSAAAMAGRFVTFLSCDTAAGAAKALRVLKNL
jgi:predicted amino acid-binding ACT domain protein